MRKNSEIFERAEGDGVRRSLRRYRHVAEASKCDGERDVGLARKGQFSHIYRKISIS